jgi:ORF6N domain
VPRRRTFCRLFQIIHIAIVVVSSVPHDLIEEKIYFDPRSQVINRHGLAMWYGGPKGNLNLAVRRKTKRFPEDFMFPLSREECQSLLCKREQSSTHGAGTQAGEHTRWRGIIAARS